MIINSASVVNGMVCQAMSQYVAMPSWAYPHLYFKRSQPGVDGDVLMVDINSRDAPPEGFELAIPIQRHWDGYRVEREVRRALNTAPILAY